MRKIFLAVFTIFILNNLSLIAENKIPSSKRSRKAIQKVKPILEKELTKKSLQYGSPIFIRVFKKTNELELWMNSKGKFSLFRVYKICYYSGELGPKLKQGDCQSPEGFYFVTPNRLNLSSKFHLSFDIGYPNAYDKHHKRTGNAIMIHGNCVSIGCYAMTDSLIEDVYSLANAAFHNGQSFFKVHIFPFRMTDENMKNHNDSKWISFWKNLKEGYDYFEINKMPPNVIVRNGKYVFQ